MEQLCLTPELTRRLEAAQRKSISASKYALQIVPVQLRVWQVDQNDVACRPWYIFCLELYPRGKVINQTVHSPASEKPSAYAMLSFLLNHINDPPQGEEPQRPTHVSFVDDAVTEQLSPILNRLKIEVGTLTLADGVDEYVKKFSDKLISMERASRGDSAERPGILSVDGITEEMGKELAASAVEMFSAQPWKRIPEHIALEIRLPSTKNDKYRERYYVTVLGSDEKVFGFALMPSLNTLREKYKRVILSKTTSIDDSSDDEEVEIAEAGAPESMGDEILLCASCGRRVGDSVHADGARYVERCAGCKKLLYCNDKCQKLDWRERHRSECTSAKDDPSYIFTRKEWAWLKRELALLFFCPTALPFDDLDAFEKHSWKYVEDKSPPLYPLPYATVTGGPIMSHRMDRPSQKEMEYMTLIAKALTECMSPPPKDGVMHLASGVSISVAENLAESIHH